jgi:hypothetical protein
MTLEDFENWIETHGAEAIDRIEIDEAELSAWLKMYAKSLKNLADEMSADAEDEDEDEDEEFSDEEDS